MENSWLSYLLIFTENDKLSLEMQQLAYLDKTETVFLQNLNEFAS